MRRMWRYLEGLKARAVVMVLVAAGNAACQTGGWLLVRDAIDNGIRVGNVHHDPCAIEAQLLGYGRVAIRA